MAEKVIIQHYIKDLLSMKHQTIIYITNKIEYKTRNKVWNCEKIEIFDNKLKNMNIKIVFLYNLIA